MNDREEWRDMMMMNTIRTKTGHPKTTKENSTNKLGEMTRKHNNNRMQKKPNDFGVKYGNQEI